MCQDDSLHGNNYIYVPTHVSPFSQDGGTPANSITNILAILVEDALDPPPTFTESVYFIDVAEGIYNNVSMHMHVTYPIILKSGST